MFFSYPFGSPFFKKEIVEKQIIQDPFKDCEKQSHILSTNQNKIHKLIQNDVYFPVKICAYVLGQLAAKNILKRVLYSKD